MCRIAVVCLWCLCGDCFVAVFVVLQGMYCVCVVYVQFVCVINVWSVCGVCSIYLLLCVGYKWGGLLAYVDCFVCVH